MFGVGLQHRLAEHFFSKIDKMNIKIRFEMSLIVVEAIRGRCASFMIHSDGNGFGDFWWTGKLFYFSSIDE